MLCRVTSSAARIPVKSVSPVSGPLGHGRSIIFFSYFIERPWSCGNVKQQLKPSVERLTPREEVERHSREDPFTLEISPQDQKVQITEPYTRTSPTQIQEPHAWTSATTLSITVSLQGRRPVTRKGDRRQEIQEIKNNRKAETSAPPSSSPGEAAAEIPDNHMEDDDNPPPPERKAPAVSSYTGSHQDDLGQKLTEMQNILNEQAEAVGNLTLAVSTYETAVSHHRRGSHQWGRI
ncbi:hypothetical protein HPB50_022197 [Hyalomma asiaticum]|uniref:Uncharacterized protein n=1 Tax=Hyalomma asiaticum TaxID=266040 RepID=A0ACB7T7I2_HYAAI|nr:hypothetical protein HPB50_022197 [Hyalomma asiaticum]